MYQSMLLEMEPEGSNLQGRTVQSEPEIILETSEKVSVRLHTDRGTVSIAVVNALFTNDAYEGFFDRDVVIQWKEKKETVTLCPDV